MSNSERKGTYSTDPFHGKRVSPIQLMEDLKICKNCEFFEPNPQGGKTINVWGSCKSEKFVLDDDPVYYDNQVKPAKDHLFYFDGEMFGNSCGFVVGPEFGCIHWEKKE